MMPLMKNNPSTVLPGHSSLIDLPLPRPTMDEAGSWVRGELIRNLMNVSSGVRLWSVLLMCALVLFGWQYAPAWKLLGWLACGVVLASGRSWAERVYNDFYAHKDLAWQERFLKRYTLLWAAGGCIWGLSPLVFFEGAPRENQFLCAICTAGMATYAPSNLALYLPLCKRYLNALFITLFLSLGFQIIQGGFEEVGLLEAFLVLSVIHWRLLLRAGIRNYRVHYANYELLYHNSVLINSLTDQRQAAVSAVATKNRFLASAAHDIRQPVLALSLYADWLRSEPELVREIAPKIVRATQAVNALFDSLFDLARLDSGQVRLQIEPVDMAQLLHDLELQYRPPAESKGLEFRVRGVAGMVMTDPVRVRRMIGNLLANAIRYTDKGGMLLAARHTPAGIRIEVWDTGIGIAAENLGDVFMEFYKVTDHAGTSDGFGLGLAIVARLSQALDHPVQVSSRPGRGSVFRVTLRDVDAVQAQRRMDSVLG
ncbi:MAG: histidine kinase [Variovorax sp.]|nr:histidine kinase [Variovorax sp.]